MPQDRSAGSMGHEDKDGGEDAGLAEREGLPPPSPPHFLLRQASRVAPP